MPSPPPNQPPRRASRTVKLVLMGVAGAALLYSCAPGIGGGLGALPYLWFFSNPFYRGPVASAPSTTGSTVSRAGPTADAPAAQSSQRGGFGGTAGQSGTSSTS